KTTIVTFGGAFSNHIAATAYASKINNFRSIGIIRGEELKEKFKENPTLKLAVENDMELIFVSRTSYREKEKHLPQIIDESILKNSYIIPEGGTNVLAIKGCKEILGYDDKIFDYICCSVGTAGTIIGLIESAIDPQNIIGFPALKGNFHQEDINFYTSKKNWTLNLDYHFGGYGKVDESLISFLNQFYQKYKVPLDPIYTGKMVYGILDLIYKNFFPKKTKILVIHTGGLQGINGINIELIKKNKTIIEY
ncbi:MAG: 1-aminocyclopropane-1-carboxylate deaminase/D-cysteine desulfhydrase, partial [Flavobacterium sp.]